MAWKLPEEPAALLALAKTYPFPAPPQSYLLRSGVLAPIAEADFSERIPLLGHGSNRSPEQLTRKFTLPDEPEWEIPVTFAWLEDYDVVYSAHVTQYGAIASTLVHAPGCRVRIALNWLNERQVIRMHATEGRNYPFGRLEGLEVEVEGGPSPRFEAPYVYNSRHGALGQEGKPVGLAAVQATGRSHAALEQEAVQLYLRDRYHAGEEIDNYILANIRDLARRESLIARMAEHALPSTVPHFIQLDPLDELP
ncbi:MAG: hypothetical protein WDZ84_04670 [Rhodovibrionaceae bacterium]